MITSLSLIRSSLVCEQPSPPLKENRGVGEFTLARSLMSRSSTQCFIRDNTLENCFIQISSSSHAHVHIIYENTKGQIPPTPSSGKQNIHAKEVYWRDCGTDYGDLDNNSSNSAYKHSLQLSMTNCLLPNKLAQYKWTCHCVKFATLTLQTNETESIRQCMQMQCQKTYSNQATCKTDTTTPYNMQQGVQTDETCNIQQWGVRLHGVLNQLSRGNKITKTDSLGEGFLNGCTNQVI